MTILAAAFDIGWIVRTAIAKRDAVVGFPAGINLAAVNAAGIAPKDDESAGIPDR